MKLEMRSILVIIVIVLVFVMSWASFNHIDNSYIMKDDIELERLQSENDSLKTVIKDLQPKDKGDTDE